jgi:hypothetical protein
MHRGAAARLRLAVRSGSITIVVTVLPLLFVISCSKGPDAPRAIGEAYAGPATMKIRSDIPLQSSTVATVRHGERLEIVQRRRRFMRVRTPSGAIGWTDERQLLASGDMADLKALATIAAKMPSQGKASTFGDLNVHTLPARQAPSFIQIKENEKVDVLLHVSAPRAGPPSRPILPPVPKKQKAAKKPVKPPKYPPPPMPTPPPPPANWLELSKTNRDDSTLDPPEEVEPPKPVPQDDWSLVRNAAGQTGWALTRRLFMAIPDEVAQYAEGHRIVAYFALGDVQDGEDKKSNWLWATLSDTSQPFDFDSFRIFIWSLKRHRYETAYIERNLEGYLPILVHEVNYNAKGSASARYPGFSACLERTEGRRRREFALLGNIVRLAGDLPCETPPVVPTAPSVAQSAPVEGTGQPQPGLLDRIRGWFRKSDSKPR